MATYKETVLADSPYLYLDYDTDTTNKGSATGATAVGSGGVSAAQPAAGTLNGASAEFGTGANSFISLNNSGQTITSDWSFETWYKKNPATSATTRKLIRVAVSSTVFWEITIATGTGYMRVFDNAGVNDGVTNASTIDGNWHHITVTKASNAITFYVDGVSVGSVSGTVSAKTGGTIYVGGFTISNTGLGGNLDETALYRTVLTPARIQERYTLGTTVQGSPTTGAFGTARATVTAPTVIGRTVARTTGAFNTARATAASPAMTATAEQNIPGLNQRILVTGLDSISGTQINQTLYADANNKIRLRFDLSSIPQGAVISSAVLSMRQTSVNSNITILVRRAAEAWTQNVYSNTGALSSPSFTLTSPGGIGSPRATALELRDVVQSAALSADGNGLVITAPSGSFTASNNTADDFKMVVNYTVPATGAFGTAPVAGGAPAMTAQAQSSTQGVFTTARATVSAPAVTALAGVSVQGAFATAQATASGTAWVASSDFIPDTTGVFGTATATGDANLSWSQSTQAATDPASGTAQAPQPALSVEYNARGSWTTARAQVKAPSLLQTSPLSDPLYQAILTSVGFADDWYRVDESVGSTLQPVTAWVGDYDDAGDPLDVQFGVPVQVRGAFNFGLEGPEGRPAMRMTAGYVDAFDNSQDVEFVWSTELVIRTNKKTGTLTYGTANGSGSAFYTTHAFLDAGRIRIANYGPSDNVVAETSTRYSVTGRQDIADGQWHHVVFGRTAKDEVIIYVDGALDVRRYALGNGNTYAFWAKPDYYLGGPAALRLPAFAGDVMELVHRTAMLSPERARAHYLSTFGIEVNSFGSARIRAKAGQVVGKGNVPIALMLDFGWENGERRFSNQDVTRADYDFGPGPGINYGTKFMGDYALEHASVVGDQYRNPVTDEPRFRDLETELDISKYDMVFFNWYPDEGSERDVLLLERIGSDAANQTYYSYGIDYVDQRLQEMLASLRRAIDKTGTSLLVTNPRLAVDLGIVKRVELVPNMQENISPSNEAYARQGQAAGLYNPHGADIDPWGNPTGEPGKNTLLGGDVLGNGISADYFYWDTHQNNRFKVRNLVDGLTDLPGLIHTDQILYQPRRQFVLDRYSVKYEDRANGLNVGDEFIFDGPKMFATNSYGGATPLASDRWFGTYAVPANSVQAGTVVTTYGATYWDGRVQKTNPYRDLATTIALLPGETLNGSTLGAKIFVDFTESIDQARLPKAVIKQLVPDAVGETTAQKAWTYSMWRTTSLATQVSGGGSGTVISLPGLTPAFQAALAQVVSDSSSTKTVLFSTIINELYPLDVIGFSRPMLERGLTWLSERTQGQAGGSVNRWAPAKATVGAGDWTSSAGRKTTGTWSTARVTGQANIGQTPNARGLFGSAQVRGQAGNISQAITFGTAKAIGRVFIEHTVKYDPTEILTMYVESGNVTLYMEEE